MNFYKENTERFVPLILMWYDEDRSREHAMADLGTKGQRILEMVQSVDFSSQSIALPAASTPVCSIFQAHPFLLEPQWFGDSHSKLNWAQWTLLDNRMIDLTLMGNIRLAFTHVSIPLVYPGRGGNRLFISGGSCYLNIIKFRIKILRTRACPHSAPNCMSRKPPVYWLRRRNIQYLVIPETWLETYVVLRSL